MKKYFIPSKIKALLQEKGFEEPCLIADDEQDNGTGDATVFYTHENGLPTYDQVTDWFETKHNLNIWVDCSKEKKWIWTINLIEQGTYIQSDDSDIQTERNWWETKKEAYNEAFIHALTLID